MKLSTLRQPVDRALGPVAGSIMRVATAQPQVVITFDDGPLPGMTDKLAQVLDDHGAKAVFFVLMTRVNKAPAMVRDLAGAGHEIALHGLDHRRISTLQRSDASDWLRSSKLGLEDALGQPVRWFRPPHGAQNPLTHLQAKRAGLDTVLWSGTTWDWREATHDERVAKAMSASVPGAILLAHDGAADHTDRSASVPVSGVDKVALLEDILSGLRDRSLSAVTLTEALAAGSPVRRLSFSR